MMLAQFNPTNVQQQGLSLALSNCGNPDYRQDSERPLPETACGRVGVGSLAEASMVCRKYIRFYELGAGNWTGGQVTDSSGVVIARVSYNGRVWEGDKVGVKEIAV